MWRVGLESRHAPPLRVGVIGLGVGEQHALAYQRHPRCHVAALCDLMDDKLRRARQYWPEARLTRRADDLLDDPDLDVISIASYDQAHGGQALSALNRDKHVFVEKPLCRSGDELDAIRRAWRLHHCPKLSCNLVLRASPLYRWVRDQIAEGQLGDVYAFDGDYLYGRLHKITDGWRRDVPEYSVLKGGGIHLVDLMMWLTGQRPVAVSASGNRICTAGTRFRYNDFVAAAFEFPSGLIGRITANFGCVHRHQHVVRIFGTKGTFIHDDLGPRLHTSRDASVSPRGLDFSSLPASKGELIPPFVHAIVNGEDVRPQTLHEFDVINVCIATDEAVAKKGSLEILYDDEPA